MRIHPTKLEKAPLNKRYYSDSLVNTIFARVS